MLHDFVTSNTTELIRRCKAKAAKRFLPSKTPSIINHGVPLFLEQLVVALRIQEETNSKKIKSATSTKEIGRAAALHGAELMRTGYSVEQVVHDYGDVCQSVTEMAIEQKVPISTDDFRVLNRSLDYAIADSVTAYGTAHQSSIDNDAVSHHQRLNAFIEEQRRLIDIAIRTFTAIKTGDIGVTGATGALLIHALEQLRDLSDRDLPNILNAAGTAVDPVPPLT